MTVVINKNNPENLYFTNFDNTFVYNIYPEHRLKYPESRENSENFHLCITIGVK